jgi:hypothetical protein
MDNQKRDLFIEFDLDEIVPVVDPPADAPCVKVAEYWWIDIFRASKLGLNLHPTIPSYTSYLNLNSLA